MLQYDELIERLRSMANPEALEGMARFGIHTSTALGVSLPELRALAKKIGKDHPLAKRLWASGIHEARMLASMIDDPKMVDEEQMESWVSDFNSWDICDQCCSNLLDKTKLAHQKAIEWSNRQDEFVKRAGFALMACLAVHDKKSGNERFLKFLPAIRDQSTDDRNFVKKAVNWALRQIGKRNLELNRAAIETANEIKANDSRAARWIAADALRELTSDGVARRMSGNPLTGG